MFYVHKYNTKCDLTTSEIYENSSAHIMWTDTLKAQVIKHSPWELVLECYNKLYGLQLKFYISYLMANGPWMLQISDG